MRWEKLFKSLFWIQVGVNLVGAVGPELSFDALWYHLPIARLIAERGWVGIIPGGLLYYSGMPRLMEFINAFLLTVGDKTGMNSPETLPKILSLMTGVAAARVLFAISRKYVDESKSWGVVLVWYTTLLVGWQSIVVYSDLARTLLVFLAVWFLIERRWLVSAIFVGLAYSVKTISGVDAVILILSSFALSRNWKIGFMYALIFSVFPLGWGISNVIQGYGFFYPLAELRIIQTHVGWGWHQLLSTVIGDGRYILPEAALLLLWFVRQITFTRTVLLLIFLQGIFGIGYRAAANAKFVPILLKQETKDHFLTTHLNFTYGDWYDTDGWVSAHLRNEKYLVIGVHNTYYLPGILWDHDSFAPEEACYHAILVQGLYEHPENWELIHSVPQTATVIYHSTQCYNRAL